MPDLAPVRREIRVDGDPALAFEVFTDGIGGWWPLRTHAVHHDGTVAFADDKIVETAADGCTAVWGTVDEWVPPHRVAFTWHPGAPESEASRVTVTFTPDGAGTLVALEHTGWEVFADPAAARAEYEQGWVGVLERFGAAAVERTWAVLVHRPAGEVQGHAVFADERFAHHVAFLRHLHERGYLVAAGPLPDEAGAGMAVLRLPGGGRLAEVTALATAEDGSVVSGLFAVDVRPWDVRLT